jgi:hypothetical protein
VAASPAPQIPVLPPALGRGELLSAVSQVASAAAGGRAYPTAAADLAGRRFALRLPFGCGGPPPAAAALRYSLDAQTLRLSARPESWGGSLLARALIGQAEAVEGFWLSRPWLLTEDCPAPPQAPSPLDATPSAPETVAIAQVFEPGGSRLLRRGGKAYEATKKLDGGPVPGPAGLRLVLEGRLTAGDGHRPIRCFSARSDRPPVCMVIVELDRVAFETPDGDMLAEWRS